MTHSLMLWSEQGLCIGVGLAYCVMDVLLGGMIVV